MKNLFNYFRIPSENNFAMASIVLCLTAGAAHSEKLNVNLGAASASVGLRQGVSANVSIGSPSSPAATASVNTSNNSTTAGINATIGTAGTNSGGVVDVSLGLGGGGSAEDVPPTTPGGLAQPALREMGPGAVPAIDPSQLIGYTLVSSDGMTLAIITAAWLGANGYIHFDLQISAALGATVSSTTVMFPTVTPNRNAIRIGMSAQQFVNFIA